jgi:hypothetical protein
MSSAVDDAPKIASPVVRPTMTPGIARGSPQGAACKSELTCLHRHSQIRRNAPDVRRAATNLTFGCSIRSWIASALKLADVPSFDPDTSGVNARGLVLGQESSATALATGFISPDNPDATAASTTELTGAIDRTRVTFWNAVPWRYAPERLSGATRDAGAC